MTLSRIASFLLLLFFSLILLLSVSYTSLTLRANHYNPSFVSAVSIQSIQLSTHFSHVLAQYGSQPTPTNPIRVSGPVAFPVPSNSCSVLSTSLNGKISVVFRDGLCSLPLKAFVSQEGSAIQH